MLTAYALFEDKTTATANSVPGLAGMYARRPVTLWVDLEEPPESELAEVAALFRLDPEAVEDCLQGEQRPRVDEFDDLLFLVLYGAVETDDIAEFTPLKLAVFFGPGRLITVHHKALPSVRAVRARCDKMAAPLLAKGVDHVLYTIIDTIVDNFVEVAEAFNDTLIELEEASFAPLQNGGLLEEITRLRREFLEFRRIAASQRELLLPIAKGEYEYVSEALEKRFSHVHDHLTMTIELIDGLREILMGIRDNYQAALANRMNAVMKTLTLFASLCLPLSLLAGIYGMNTHLWPNPADPYSFWYVMGAMGVISAGMLMFFAYRRWL